MSAPSSPLFERFSENPILDARAWPYPVNTVFNPGACLVGEETVLLVRVEGREANRDGFGARVALLRDGKATMWRRIHTDGSYLSACEAVAHFGLGSAAAVEAVGVIWPGGARERFGVAGVDQTLTLRQGEGQDWP